MIAYVEITVVPMGDPEPAWCDTCLLSSALRQTFEIILGDNLWGRLWTVQACDQCGSSMEAVL